MTGNRESLQDEHRTGPLDNQGVGHRFSIRPDLISEPCEVRLLRFGQLCGLNRFRLTKPGELPISDSMATGPACALLSTPTYLGFGQRP